MTDALERLVDSLSTQLEQQRFQLNALQASQNAAGPATQQNVARFDRFSVPDPIKLIPAYAGEPACLSSWIDSVDQKIEYSRNLINDQVIFDSVMPLWTGIIRDKIVKDANDLLIRNQTRLDWADIKKTLKEELGDKRDLATLIAKITQLKQGNLELDAYYQQCKTHLADINSNLLANDDTKACVKVLMASYEAMMINSFIDGLPDYLSSLTRIYKPRTLNEAYEGALEQFTAIQKRREKLKPQDSTQPIPRSSKPQFQQIPPKPPIYQNPFNAQYNNFAYRQYPVHPNFRPQFNQNMVNSNPNSFPYRAQYNSNPVNPNQNSLSYRPQQPTLPNIKPDPSGQNRQNNSKQVIPYRRASQINAHETAEEIPDDCVYEENSYNENPEIQEINPQTEQFDELNFCIDLQHQTTE